MRRRDFFAAMGGGIAVLLVDDAGAQQRGGRGGRGGQQMPQDGRRVAAHWRGWRGDGLHGKVEIGQNARTSLTAAVAEELARSRGLGPVHHGDTALTPFDGGTAGSQTTPNMWPQMRRAAATAREMLMDLAARKWNVDRASVSIATQGGLRQPLGRIRRTDAGAKARPDDRGRMCR